MKIYIIILLSFMLSTTHGQFSYYTRDINNQSVDLQTFLGEKLTVLDFWATWCKPCVQLMPKLTHISKTYDSAGVTIIGVNIDDPRSINKVKPFAESLQVEYPLILDTDKELMDEMNVTAVPALVIIDSKGKILWHHEGFSLGDEIIIEEKILELLQ